MTKELIEIDKGITPVGLKISPGTTLDKWSEIAAHVTRVGQGYWWWVGDLANYASHNFSKEDKEKALQSLQSACGCGEKYINLLSWTARSYALRDRIPNLSISHHMRVAHLPRVKRGALLHKALKKQWGLPLFEQKIRPHAKRVFTIVMKVPIKTFKATVFKKALEVVVHMDGVKWYVQGQVKKLGGPRSISHGRVGSPILISK